MRWVGYFECLLNVADERETGICAVVSVNVPAMGEENEGRCLYRSMESIEWNKSREGAGVDGCCPEYLKKVE